MHMERLLSQISHWASAQDGRYDDAEWLVAEGFLGQLFTDHLARNALSNLLHACDISDMGALYESNNRV